MKSLHGYFCILAVAAITAFYTVDCSVEYILFCTQIGRYVSHMHHSDDRYNGFSVSTVYVFCPS